MKIYRALTGLVWLNQFARGTLSPSACACVCVCVCVGVCVFVYTYYACAAARTWAGRVWRIASATAWCTPPGNEAAQKIHRISIMDGPSATEMRK